MDKDSMKKIYDKREEDAIYFEHQESYKEFNTNLQKVWLEEIFSPENTAEAETEEAGSGQSDYEDLLGTIGKDTELLRLYVAAGITMCTEEGRRFGIPKDIVSDIRRKAFLELADIESEETMYQVTVRVSGQLKQAYRKYSMEGYSYLVKCAVEQIHNHRYDKISAGYVAEKVGSERTYLAKIFRKETGKTLTEYIKMVKMELAAELVKTHIYQLGEISELLGYANYSYFSRQFKEYYGIAPEKYETQKEK